MSKPTLLACVLFACMACHDDKASSSPAPKPALAAARRSAVVLDPHQPLHVVPLGTPVKSARTWTSALVPNARGGWNFITQSWELGSKSPPEFVVVDLATSVYSLMDSAGGYAVNKYQVANQLRAANGRVFFPQFNDGLAYYDPKDETVKDLPPVIPQPAPDKIIYSAVFGPDGMLYAGTQSSGLPTIIQIDPDKLTSRVIGHVGSARKGTSYAYEIAVDPPWIYATVGEMPWELAALNIKTGESKILATRSERPWMHLETRPDGVRAQLITDVHTPQVKSDYVWCVDGGTIPAEVGPKVKAPFKAHRLAPLPQPQADAPELDLTDINPDASGDSHVRWHARGSEDWKVAVFRVKHTVPVNIEALAPLPDGSVIGGTKQYHGLFTANGSSTGFLGLPTPSQSVITTLGGLVYITGYPNGVLYAYDPAKPWTGTTRENASAPDANPKMLGNFTQSAVKYAYFLVAGQKRLYFAGRRERDGVGAGVGYYEPARQAFGGHNNNLADVIPAGLAVLPDRVVLSERLRNEATTSQAELVIYDENLAEIERQVVKPGLTDTGWIYAAPDKNVIIGVLPDAVYRYDLAAKKVIGWKDLGGKADVFARRPDDDSLWVVLGGSLVRVDPVTLQTQVYGQGSILPSGLEHLVWAGDDLYGSAGPDLYRISRVGLP